MRTTIWVTMRLTKWTMHYPGALKTSLPNGCAFRSAQVDLPLGGRGNKKDHVAQHQQAVKTGFVFSMAPPMHGIDPHPSSMMHNNNVSARWAGGSHDRYAP